MFAKIFEHLNVYVMYTVKCLNIEIFSYFLTYRI